MSFYPTPVRVKFFKNEEEVEGFMAELRSPFALKVFVQGDTVLGRYPAYHEVQWDVALARWAVV